MEGFSDLLWLLIMFLVITRGLSAARRGKQRPQPPPSTDIPDRSSRPAEPAVDRANQSVDQIQTGPGQTSRGSRRSDPVTEFRRRLMEAAREWEAEQRRRAGIPTEDLPGTASPRPEATTEPGHQPSRPEATEPEPRDRSAWEARDVTPERVAEQLAERGRLPGSGQVPARRPRHPLEPAPEVTRHGSPPARPVSVPQADRPEVEAEPAGVASSEAPAHEPLARLERFQPLKRAVVLADILGLPRALSDDPSSKRGARGDSTH